MREQASPDPSNSRPSSSTHRQPAPPPILLWRLRGATDDLRGLAIETSFGYAFGLELDAELVLLHLTPNLECLVAYADRIHSALIAQGWHVIEEHSHTRSVHDLQ